MAPKVLRTGWVEANVRIVAHPVQVAAILAMATAVATTARAQDYVASACQTVISLDMKVDGEWFSDVGMILQHNPGGGNIGYYETISDPTSDDGDYIWFEGSGTFSCWSYTIPGTDITVWSVKLIGNPGGTLLPTGGSGGSSGACLVPDPTDPTCNGGSGGGGGSSGGGSSGGGSGSGPDPGCSTYALAPGCYDVYIDGVYSGTICC